MAADKLSPTDSRVQHRTAEVNGKTYHYLLGEPAGEPKATILLVHGFPDLSLGWRYQVPFLQSLGLRVIVPDTLGYGRTDAPTDVALYSLKSMSDDMAALVRGFVGADGQIILGGHDWGGMLAWRLAQWHPRLVRAVFSVCTPYIPPSPVYVSLEALVEHIPNFRYQLQFAGPDLEATVAAGGPAAVRRFLAQLHGGRVPGDSGRTAFTSAQGADLDVTAGKDGLDVDRSPLESAEEAEFYVHEYTAHGRGDNPLRGPLNWYRTRPFNFEEEKALLVEAGGTQPARIATPAMIITASRDTALPPSMAKGMARSFDDLVVRAVEASHWALWEAPEEVNGHIGEFIARALGEGEPKPSI